MIDPIASTGLSLNLAPEEQSFDIGILPSGLQSVDQLLAENAPPPQSAFPVERRRSTRRPQEEAAMMHAVLYAIDQSKPRHDNQAPERAKSCMTTLSYQQF